MLHANVDHPPTRVSVDRADGSTAVFRVTAVAAYPKSGSPGAAVHGPADHAALRLVTCGGRFDRRRGGYLDNVVVYATLSVVERSSIVGS